MLATIVLLTKNGARFLPEVLESILSQEVTFNFRALAIDSGSTDGTLEILAQNGIETIEIPSDSFSHGGTRNFGAKLAGEETDFLVYLTQDATPAGSAWLANLVEPLLQDARTAAAFSRHIPRASSSPSLVRQLTEKWQTGQSVRLVNQMPDDHTEYERNVLYYATFSDTSSVIRKSVWEAIPFPEVDFAEDVAWADRALRAGHRIVFEPQSVVIHSHDYPILEQFRQNVDHAAGMRVLFPNILDLHGLDWVRVFVGVPVEVLADYQFIKSSPRYANSPPLKKAHWMLLSPLWHAASAFGAWVGVHMDRWPASIKRLLSHQERVRQGKL